MIKKDIEEQAYLATHDKLTDLINQRIFMDALDRAVARARRGRKSAIMVIQIDNFRAVNERVGREQADIVLRNLVDFFKMWIRKEDLLARLDDNDFAALMEYSDIEHARIAAERMRNSFSGYKEEGWNFNLSLSIGISMVTGGLRGDSALSTAESALEDSIRSGGNKVSIFGT